MTQYTRPVRQRRQRTPASALPGRPRKLTREAIIDAAVMLMDRKGASALTMRSLSDVLAVQPSTLYTYFENLEQLVEVVVQKLLESVPIANAASGASLREQLVEHYVALRKVLIQHPGALDGSPGSVAWAWTLRGLDAELRALVGAGIDREVAFVTVRALSGLCSSSATLARAADHGDTVVIQRRLLAGMKPSSLPEVSAMYGMPLAKLPAELGFRRMLEVLLDTMLPSIGRARRP